MKREFILCTGHEMMGQEAMNGNNKTRIVGTAPGILRRNRLVGKQSWDPHIIFQDSKTANKIQNKNQNPSPSNLVIRPLCPFISPSSSLLLTSELLFWSVTFLGNLPSMVAAPGLHQWFGSENVSRPLHTSISKVAKTEREQGFLTFFRIQVVDFECILSWKCMFILLKVHKVFHN